MKSRNRGKSKPSLRDLSRLPLTNEDRVTIWAALRKEESPIAIAIIGASLVEHELEVELRACFRWKDDETWKSLTDDVGPLSTFHQKIIAAYGLGILDEVHKDGLNTIRQIRNAFAHAKRLISFENELITRELRTISLPKAEKSRLFRLLTSVKEIRYGPRLAYGTLCLVMCFRLLDRRLKRVTAKNSSHDRTLRRRQALANALRQPPSSRPLGLLGLLGGYQTADPMTLISGEAASEAAGSDADGPDNKDK